MKICRAKKAGFCMGVGLALRGLDEALTGQGYVMRENDRFVGASNHIRHAPPDGRERRIVTLGPIIHNRQVTEFYASKNVVVIGGVEEVRPGDIVIIRAHGIPQPEEAQLAAMEKDDVQVVDCTCPKVKKAQLAIAELSASGARLLLFGDEGHPEVRGLLSYAAGREAPLVFNSLAMMRTLVGEWRGDAFLAAQTTQDGEVYARMIEQAQAWFGPDVPVAHTICHATRLRLEEARRLADEVEAMIVVGSAHSANSRRLAEAPQHMGKPVMFVDTAADLRREALEGFASVGLTGGSSTPVCLIDAVEEQLEAWFGSGDAGVLRKD